MRGNGAGGAFTITLEELWRLRSRRVRTIYKTEAKLKLWPHLRCIGLNGFCGVAYYTHAVPLELGA
jgi:hypothetical protein